MCNFKYDSEQIDMFNPVFNGIYEIKKEKEIKHKMNAQKRRERSVLKQKQKKLEELYHFEEKHPESFLFDEFKR